MYLDPGFGSMIIQGLVASLAGLMAVLFAFKSRITAFFKKKQKGGVQEDIAPAENAGAGEGNA